MTGSMQQLCEDGFATKAGWHALVAQLPDHCSVPVLPYIHPPGMASIQKRAGHVNVR